MNQEGEQEGATTSSSRGGWGRRSQQHRDRIDPVAGFDGIDQYDDVGSAEEASAASASEYASGSGGSAAAMAASAGGKSAHVGNAMSYSGSGAPCGACKFLRRKCVKDCVFAPYFGAEHGAARFAAVHKIFGASNVNKLLRSIPTHKRFDAVITICYEAQARITNPVYGCVAMIAELQQQVQNLQSDLSFVQTQLANSRQLAAVSCLALQQQQQQQQQGGHAGGAFLPFDQTQPLDPVHVQQFLCSQISSPPPLASYHTPKDELETNLQPCIPHVYATYGSLPMGTSPSPSLVSSHVQQAHPNVE